MSTVPHAINTRQDRPSLVAVPQNNLPLILSATDFAFEDIEDSDDSSSLEKGIIWDGHEQDVLDPKVNRKHIRGLRFTVFSFYRRLFTIVFVINMSILIATCVQSGFKTLSDHLALIVLGNLFVATIVRSDYFVNILYAIITSVPLSWPFVIRRSCAKVYANGGLHTGSSISGTIWFVLFLTQATREYVNFRRISVPTLVLSYLILGLLLCMIYFAYPINRAKKHNNFERSHRFMGWTAIVLLWAQIVLLTNDVKAQEISLGKALARNPALWLAVFMTVSVTLSWLHLKKVPVRAEVLSSHAVRLYMDYTTPYIGSYNRISLSPLMEWHSFATIIEPGKTGLSIVISKAGDWTSAVIANPPKEVWVRGVPTCGVMCIVPLFKRVVVVATGSGIGPVAPHILARTIPIRLLWTAPNVRQTFGDKLVDTMLEANPDAVIYDTRVHGKPDMVKLTMRLVKEFDAEAVIIISNPTLTKKVTYGCSSRGIPAFGAIWDS